MAKSSVENVRSAVAQHGRDQPGAVSRLLGMRSARVWSETNAGLKSAASEAERALTKAAAELANARSTHAAAVRSASETSGRHAQAQLAFEQVKQRVATMRARCGKKVVDQAFFDRPALCDARGLALARRSGATAT